MCVFKNFELFNFLQYDGQTNEEIF